MRFLGHIPHSHQATELHYFLQSEGIKTLLEHTPPQGGTPQPSSLWVLDEDDLPQAEHWFEAFQQDPDNPMFYGHLKEARQMEAAELEGTPQHSSEISMRASSQPNQMRDKTTPVTLAILFLCTLLFTFGELGTPPAEPGKNRPDTALLFRKHLMFDDTDQQALVRELVDTYGMEALTAPETLSEEGQKAYKKALQSQTWKGIYPLILNHQARRHQQPQSPPPLFEKIREGEVWRLFTPALLHGGFFHIFFNMLWLIALGGQVENRLKKIRYIALLLLIALFSNTSQYLMSGPAFLGMSGVICGMATFIWVRQSRAPWEGYHLPQSTFLLLSFFVLVMLAIQCASFFMEANGWGSFAPGIANTAHLSGALAGFALAHLPFFEWQP